MAYADRACSSWSREGKRRDAGARRIVRVSAATAETDFHDGCVTIYAMPIQSAGLLMFRRRDGTLQVLLVHPGGPFWKNKDEGAWTIPKGEVAEGEAFLATAKREFREETGHEPAGTFIPLTAVKQKSGKTVHAWAIEGDLDTETIRSNTFEMEWPPRSGKRATFPEIDRAAFFDLQTARRKINAAQIGFLDELEQLLSRL